MKKEIHIKAKSDNNIYKAELGNLALVESDEVLFESDQGQEIGVVILEGLSNEEKKEEIGSSVTIIRKLNEKDKEKCLERKKEAQETLSICEEKIRKHGLSMDLLDADISFDGKKITFYFSAPGRIDFRSLVPDLASAFKKLIRLQQVGSRDKAKCMNGVVGRCGRGVCCREFLTKTSDDINIEMANIQNIGQMGSNRSTGSCGKLMCCLKYELLAYEEAKKKMPLIGAEYKIKEGVGIVISQNVMKNKIVVELINDKKRVEVDC